LKVKLINYSQSPADNVHVRGDASREVLDMVAYCARVSNPANQNNDQTAEKLVRYLIRNKHWSPLEMVSMNLEIETTRDIARQILRHRSFSFQEFSQRYADPAALGDMFVMSEARLQDPKNRQNSVITNDQVLQEMWNVMQQEVVLAAEKSYKWAIENGIAKEQARKVLPEGLTKSRMAHFAHGYTILNYDQQTVHRKNTWMWPLLVLR
jgi:thymidylate synthase (FAD)